MSLHSWFPIGTSFVLVSLFGATLAAVPAAAASKDGVLRHVYASMRITGAHIEWVPNGIGGRTPTLVYEIRNIGATALSVPVTVVGPTPRRFAGMRQHWILRLGKNSNIPALEGLGVARLENRWYAYGGEAIVWPTSIIQPGNAFSVRSPISIGDFPSGRYAVMVEYLTTHDLKRIQAQVLYFDVP
jgi:hypothetical protein